MKLEETRAINYIVHGVNGGITVLERFGFVAPLRKRPRPTEDGDH